MLMPISVILSCDLSSSVYPKFLFHIECMDVAFLQVVGHVQLLNVDFLVELFSTYMKYADDNQCNVFLWSLEFCISKISFTH